MAIISINGVPFPVLISSLNITEEVVGTTQRNTNGFLLRDSRGVKWKFAFDVAPKSLDEALLYEALVTGRGDYWPMTPNEYSSKGQPISGTGAWDDSVSTNPAGFEGDWVLAAAATPKTCIIPTPLLDLQSIAGIFGARAGTHGHTLMWSENDGGTSGSYRVVCATFRYTDTAPLLKRQRLKSTALPFTDATLGAPAAYDGRCTFATSTGSITISGPTTGADIRISNVLWLPRAFEQTQVDLLLASVTNPGGLGFPALPRLAVVTDLLPFADLVGAWDSDPANHRPIICLGDVTAMPVVPAYRGGAFDPTGLQMSVELTEV